MADGIQTRISKGSKQYTDNTEKNRELHSCISLMLSQQNTRYKNIFCLQVFTKSM